MFQKIHRDLFALHLFLLLTYNLLAQSSLNPLESSYVEFNLLQKNTPFGLDWVSIGPTMNGARVESIQIDTQNDGTMYVAFGSGNLWKTKNGGISWKPIFENMPSHGIGDIALAPSNSNIIYVGTGESLRKQRNFTLPGNGIYRSTDAGETWEHRGLSNNWHTGELVVHPDDPDIVFVAAMGKFWSTDGEKGIYKSIDGGRNWQRVLFIDNNTRANDIVISPTHPNILYASVWENNIDTTLFESVYGAKSAVYKSTDEGETWKKMNNGLPTGPKTGRIGVAVSHQNPEIAYSLVDNLNNNRQQAAEIYCTRDGGKNWYRTHDEPLLFLSVIGWYFSDIYVNPGNHDEIFALGVRIAHSVDGGKTFTYLSGNVKHVNPSAAQTLHLDHCELWINPKNPNHLAVGNDGGFYVSKNKGKDWRHFNNIPAGEFYTITVEQSSPYRIFGGTQDNATVYGHSEEWNPLGPDAWKYLWIDAWSGGDGCVTQINPINPDQIYFCMQEGNLWKMDLSSGNAKGVRPKPTDDSTKLNYHFVTPYFISEHDSKTLYHGGNYIYKSVDEAETWVKISPDLSRSDDPLKASFAISALCESALQSGLLYAGTDHGAFWTSPDDGRTWTEHSETLANGYIRSMAASQHDTSRIYLAMSGLDYDNLDAYVYRSDDYGRSWTYLGENLPKQPSNVILEDPFNEDILYLGMHRGVFISFDKGQQWTLLGREIPAVPVADLKIIHDLKQLLVATHGRGIYRVDLSPIYQVNDLQLAKSNKPHLLELNDFPAVIKRPTHKDADLKSVVKIPFYFWLPEEAHILLSIQNESGQIIWEQAISGQSGLNNYYWDQVISTEKSNQPYFIHYNAYANPGKYTLFLDAGNDQTSRKFSLE